SCPDPLRNRSGCPAWVESILWTGISNYGNLLNPRLVPFPGAAPPKDPRFPVRGPPERSGPLQDDSPTPSHPLQRRDRRPPLLLLDPILGLRELRELLRERKERLRDVYPGERPARGARPALSGLHDRPVLVVFGCRDEPDDPVVRSPQPRTSRIDLEPEVLHERRREGEQVTFSRAGRRDEPVADRFDREGLPGGVRSYDTGHPRPAREEGDRPGRVPVGSGLGSEADQLRDLARELRREPGRVTRADDDVLHREMIDGRAL